MRKPCCLAAFLLALAGDVAYPAPTPAPTPGLEMELGEETIAVDAESLSYDQKTDTVTASGKVLIRRGETELEADRVELQRSTGQANAQGNVIFRSSEGVLQADEMRLNLENETGEILDGEIQLRRNRYSLLGARIEKGQGQRYHIEKGQFTTCDCEDRAPDWSFSGEDVDIDVDGFAVITGGTFNILDVPVLYLPRAFVPVGRERQSGFLLPQFGFSNRRGFQTVVPGYLAIDRSQDATLAFDLETSARLGALGQYRYAASTQTGGTLNLSYFNEFLARQGRRDEINPEIENRSIPENRWSVIGHHRQGSPWENVFGYGEAFVVSDDSFLRDMNLLTVDRPAGEFNRTRRFTDSQAGAIASFDRSVLRVDGDYYQAFTQPQNLTLQRVPALELLDERWLGDFARLTVRSSATSWLRTNGIDGLRFDLWPRLTVPIRTGLPLRASVFVGGRETAYSLFETNMRGGLNVDSTATWILDLPGQSSREMFEVGGELGTEVTRIYPVETGNLLRLKHTVEPLLKYWYVPSVNQDSLPIFDDVDRMERRNLLTYGLVTRVFGRFAEDEVPPEEARDPLGYRSSGGVRELLSLSLLQSYDAQRIIAPVGEPPGGPRGDHFSDVDLYLRATPFDALSFSGYSSFDFSASDLSAAAVSMRLMDPRVPSVGERLDTGSSMTVSYRFITRNLLQQVDGAMRLQVTDFLGVLAGMRFDVINDKFLESLVGFRLLSTCDCWGLDITFVDKSNPNELEVRAQVTLVGLGGS